MNRAFENLIKKYGYDPIKRPKGSKGLENIKFGLDPDAYSEILTAVIHEHISTAQTKTFQKIEETLPRTGEFKDVKFPELFDEEHRASESFKKVKIKAKGMVRTIRERLLDEMQGILEGKGMTHTGKVKKVAIEDLKSRIVFVFDSYRKGGENSNVNTIANTEVYSAVNNAKQDYMERLRANNPDIEVVKTWVHNARLSKNPRPHHRALNGVTIGLDDDFEIIHDGQVILTPHPHSELLPVGEIVNCIKGNTRVNYADLEKIYRRHYSGSVYLITTSKGFNITITPNHPILTDMGFVNGNQIKIGTNIVCMDLRNVMGLSHMNINNRPPMIGQIFYFFSIIFGKSRILGSDTDFHGDGKTSYIDVITVNSELMNTINSSVFKPFNHFFFHPSGILKRLLFCLCGFYQIMFSSFTSSFCTISFLGKFLFFFKRIFFISEKRTFTYTSNCDSVGDQSGMNSPSANLEFFSNDIFRDSPNIELDDVCDINIFPFHGYVYNLQTKNNYYYIPQCDIDKKKSIIIHNCKCQVKYQYRKAIRQIK